eukprot:4455358-Prymnesium_polylepis.1
MSNEGLRAICPYALCEGCSCEAAELAAAWRPPTSHAAPAADRSAVVRACSPSVCIRSGAAKPVTGPKPVSIVANFSGDLLDGGAELNHLTGDAGDRTGSPDDDEQRAAGAARSAFALLAPPCGGGWVGR